MFCSAHCKYRQERNTGFTCPGSHNLNFIWLSHSWVQFTFHYTENLIIHNIHEAYRHPNKLKFTDLHQCMRNLCWNEVRQEIKYSLCPRSLKGMFLFNKTTLTRHQILKKSTLIKVSCSWMFFAQLSCESPAHRRRIYLACHWVSFNLIVPLCRKYPFIYR